ncbi:MAG: FtsX-like permease family protein [Planctomycetota bacterium]
MLLSWRLARDELKGRPTRTALLIGAVILASSLVVAVSSGIRSVQGTIELSLKRLVGSADARIIHRFKGRFDEALLEDVRSWPGVSAATGRLLGSITLVRVDGRMDPETERPFRATPTAIGIDMDLEQRFRSIPLRDGQWPANSHEVLLDPLTAEALDASVGDELRVQRFGTPIDLVVAAIFERRSLGTVQRPLIRIDRHVLAEAAGRGGEISGVSIILEEDVDIEAFCATNGTDLPESLSLEPAEMIMTGFDRSVRGSRLSMTIGSSLAFLCAAFIIVTGMTTAVTERQRELAILRSVGAERGQLFRSQLVLGLFIGVAGAMFGLPLGLALSRGLVWYFSDILDGGFHVSILGLGLGLTGAAGAGLAGAVYPATLASRVSPMRAMTGQARPAGARSLVACGLLGAACIALQLALMRIGDAEARFWMFAWAGLPLLLTGYFLLAVPILALVTTLLAEPLSLVFALPRGMLLRSIRATPLRHGFTSGALMVGVAVLVSNWSSAESIYTDWITKIRLPDGLAVRATGITEEQQQIIDDLPFVERTCPIGYLPLQVIGQQVFGLEGLAPKNVVLVGFDPERFFAMNAVEWRQGDPATAVPRLEEGNACLVADRFLVAREMGLGDTITLGAGKVEHEYEIVGVVSSAGLDVATQLFGIRDAYAEYAISCVFVDRETVIRDYDNTDAHILQIDLDEGISDADAEAAIHDAAPGVLFRSARWIRETIDEVASAVMTVLSTEAFLALILACFGTGNVILANIHSRRYQYGVLRSIGAGRGLLVRLVLTEAGLLAVGGAVTGTILGLHLAQMAAIHYRDLAGLRLSAPFPVVPAIAGWLILLGLTLMAATPGIVTLIRRPLITLIAGGRGG